MSSRRKITDEQCSKRWYCCCYVRGRIHWASYLAIARINAPLLLHLTFSFLLCVLDELLFDSTKLVTKSGRIGYDGWPAEWYKFHNAAAIRMCIG
jgi:hypothetical protein